MEPNERQTVEANLHSLAVQRQAAQSQLSEAELALKELSGAKTAYRLVGGLMVQAPVDELKAEVTRRKESAEARLELIEKQQERIKDKLQ
jgi:prefoldin beta subunit